jgi:hypothetical protein
MPWSSYAWAAVLASAGCGWSISTVEPSWPPRFSPHYYWAHVAPVVVQEQLRRAFTRWGQPARLRVDNGKPWGSWSDLPPVLALWLIGLGSDMIWNDPGCPQQNGTVERSQGTAKRWAEPHTCQTETQLQERLDEVDRMQREEYPVAAGQSRWQLFPGLARGGRPYRVAAETRCWDVQRVRTHLSEYQVSRRVDGQGKVSVYNRNLYVGTRHKGQEVWVLYSPEEEQWVISDGEGRQLRTIAAPEIAAATIRGLELGGGK